MKKNDFASNINYNVVNLIRDAPKFNKAMLEFYNKTFGRSTITIIGFITKRVIGRNYKKLGFEIETYL
jgi:hypothetical protein